MTNFRVALVGSPNSGKTTLFNSLTGMSARVGNYPGVTVERKSGDLLPRSSGVEILDTPGLYSLQPLSEDEHIACKVLRGDFPGEQPIDGVALVADATAIENTLPLLAEILALGLPTVLILTMVDELKARGGAIDLFRLQKEIGVPVVGVVGTKGLGLGALRDALVGLPGIPPASPQKNRGLDWEKSVLLNASRIRPHQSKLTQAVDSFLLHPFWGVLFFFGVMAFFFQSIFTWAAPAMDYLDVLIATAANSVTANLPAAWYSSLLADGVIRGVGAVLIFIPQLVILFGILFLMEATGYMARAAFLADRVMGAFGLEGRSFVALLSSHACAVPGILATRTIPSKQTRLATIMASPLATCSARLPVYTLVIGAFIPATTILGPFSLQGFTLMGLYLIGSGSALLVASALRKGPLQGSALSFYLELPPYRAPSIWSGIVHVGERVRTFLRRAGTVILAGSVALWCLLHFPNKAPKDLAGLQREQYVLENSYAAGMGKALEPLTAPLGFDWKINVGIIGAFGARELIISTMGQVYALEGATENAQRIQLRDTLRGSSSRVGALDTPSAIALLVFFAYALLCLSTLAVMRRETGGWGWPAASFFGLLGVAWLLAALARAAFS